MRATLLVAILALGLTGAACTAAQSTAGAPAAMPAPMAGGGIADSAAKGSLPNGVSAAEGIPSLLAQTRDLIMTANVSMRSDDPWKTADAAKQIAQGLGGTLMALNESGSGTQRSATVVMSVPSTRFDDAISALKRLDGEVLSSNVDAKDVTDQLVDLDARITTLKAEEARYLALFNRANTVDEMLKVQSALSQLRTQIEQLSAQQKNMKDRVAFSTISLSVSPISNPTPNDPIAKWDPVRTFSAAATALVAMLRAFADVAIWLLVFGWIPLVALAIALVATRTRRPVKAPAA
jgi:uncharacterized protein YdcH (DUF465 family)